MEEVNHSDHSDLKISVKKGTHSDHSEMKITVITVKISKYQQYNDPLFKGFYSRIDTINCFRKPKIELQFDMKDEVSTNCVGEEIQRHQFNKTICVYRSSVISKVSILSKTLRFQLSLTVTPIDLLSCDHLSYSSVDGSAPSPTWSDE